MAANPGLDAIIAKMRGLAGVGEEAARIAAPLVEAEVKATAAAGTTPDGKPWAPKKGGGRAMVNAAAAVSARADGSAVVVTLEGPEVLHNFGTGHAPKRQVLPDAGAELPKPIADAARTAAEQAFANATGGR